jgi:PIN domain nuclease of toxin-antitoxin system
VRLLLDTHVLLWAATAPDQLRDGARTILEDGSNEVFVSVVSAWEIAIKQSLSKLDLPRPAEEWLPEVLRRSNFEVADLGLAAALRVRALPWHHRDPFDRLLIAQALEGNYTFVTRDDAVTHYGVSLLRA